jgi:hypothetical protein
MRSQPNRLGYCSSICPAGRSFGSQTDTESGVEREMRSGGGPTGILVYCADYRCSHSIETSAEQWPDDVRLSEIEAWLPRF